MSIKNLKTEYEAYQAIRRQLVTEIEELDDTVASASAIRLDFRITPTVLRRLASAGKIRPIRRSRRRKARVRYRVRDVLLAIVRDGVYGTGRIRNGGHQD